MHVDFSSTNNAAMDSLRIWLREERGRAVWLADHLGISPAALSQWRQVPVRHARAIEALTGIGRQTLCPTVFGSPA